MYMCFIIFIRYIFVKSSVRYPPPERCCSLSLIVLVCVRVRKIVMCFDVFRSRSLRCCSIEVRRVVARVCACSRFAVASCCVSCWVLWRECVAVLVRQREHVLENSEFLLFVPFRLVSFRFVSLCRCAVLPRSVHGENSTFVLPVGKSID